MPVLTMLVEQLLSPVPGGTGRVTRELATAMAAQAPSGWELRTVCAWHRSTTAAEIEVANRLLSPRRMPAGRRILSALWERGLPPWVGGDVVLAPTPLFPPAAPWRRGRRRQQRIVIVHDAVPFTHPGTLTSRGVSWHRRMIGRAIKGVEVIGVPSQAVADELGRHLHVPVELPTAVLGWGVGAGLAEPSDADDRRSRLGLPEDYLIFVGTIEPRKGLDVLIRALDSRGDEAPVLAVVGPVGWGDVDLSQLVASSSLAPGRVLALGAVTDSDLAAAIAGARALVAPSRSEGFGLPVLEAMSLGVPVIVSDVPALTELVGDAGIVAPVEDSRAFAAAIATLGDESEREHYSTAGSGRAAGYSWDSAAQRLWRLVSSPSC